MFITNNIPLCYTMSELVVLGCLPAGWDWVIGVIGLYSCTGACICYDCKACPGQKDGPPCCRPTVDEYELLMPTRRR